MPFDAAPFGIVGLEIALALYIRALVESGLIGWPRLIEMMTIAPARLCGLDQAPRGLGTLSPGAPADITVIDPEEAWTIDPTRFAGKSRNTPFAGLAVKGRAIATVVGGRVLMDRHRRFAVPATV